MKLSARWLEKGEGCDEKDGWQMETTRKEVVKRTEKADRNVRARVPGGCPERSKHADGVILGTIQARTHVQLALACQRSMPCAQHRLRLTMQHVCGHSGNLGNECADHGAALGSLGLISSHNVATRFVRHNFDTSACCDGCNIISEILERLQHIGTDATSPPQDGS